MSIPNTVVIQIGNTDNKLTQNMWAHYIVYMRGAIEENAFRVHFQGGSDYDAPWQNACWCCEVLPEQIERLKEAVTACRKQFDQESAAVVFGTTEFI